MIQQTKQKRKSRVPPPKQTPLQGLHVAQDQLFIDTYNEIFQENETQIPKASDLETFLKAIKFKSTSLFDLHESSDLSVKDMQRICIINGFLLVLDWHQWNTNYSLNKNALIWALMKIGYLSIEWQFVNATKRGQYFN